MTQSTYDVLTTFGEVAPVVISCDETEIDVAVDIAVEVELFGGDVISVVVVVQIAETGKYG